MIYLIEAGEAYGESRTFVVDGPETTDLEKLHEDFLKIDKQMKNEVTFAETERFVKWIVDNHGFTEPPVSYLFTEN